MRLYLEVSFKKGAFWAANNGSLLINVLRILWCFSLCCLNFVTHEDEVFVIAMCMTDKAALKSRTDFSQLGESNELSKGCLPQSGIIYYAAVIHVHGYDMDGAFAIEKDMDKF